MCSTCFIYKNMSKMIQIRDVPDRVHGTLKSRAARDGMSLSDFIKPALERVAERPSMAKWLETTSHAKPVASKRTAAQIIRESRNQG